MDSESMITKDMKVLDVLNKYPETLEVFIETSPHFEKLKNKFLRKALASRVTIEQAAKIANVDLKEFLIKLNKKINLTYIEPNTMNKEQLNIAEEKPFWLKNLTSEKIVEFDVRPIINSGRDPFLDIMNQIKQLKEDQVLCLINSFEPIPLYTVLQRKGFDHFTEKVDDFFRVYFFKSGETNSSEGKSSSQLTDEIKTEFEKIIELDVRELPPPEPMIKILEALPQIDDKTCLLVHHHREPLMLYQKLEERGFEAITNKINENYYKVLIMKKR
jgi:uncharacterized protein (DUF2249 family)